MKLNNIFAFFLIVIAMFSCTAEDDVLGDMDGAGNNSIELTGEKMAYLSLQVASESMATKTNIDWDQYPTRDGYPISSLVFFLLEQTGDDYTDSKVVKCIYKNYSESTSTVSEKVISKVKDNLYVLVVANPTDDLKNKLLECTTFNGIQALRAEQTDLRSDLMCQQVPEKVVFGNIKGTTSTTDEALAQNTVSVGIEVSPVVALLSLPYFRVEYKGQSTVSRPVVKLTSVKYLNMKATGGLFGEGADTYFDGQKLINDVNGFDALIVGENTNSDDYVRKLMALQALTTTAFPNTSDRKVMVKLAFTVGTGDMQRIETREYTINPENGSAQANGIPAGIHAGYWYNLDVTVKVGTDIDVDLVCKTTAWKDNSYDIPVEEVK